MNENFYPDEFDIEDHRFSSLACDVALEIETSIQGLETISELDGLSSRLARILHEKVTELEKLPKEELLCEWDTFRFLTRTLYAHADQQKTKHALYLISEDFRGVCLPPSEVTEELRMCSQGKTWSDLRDALVPVMYRVSENLKYFKGLSKNRQEILRDFSLSLSKELQKYSPPYFRRLAA